MTYVHRKEYQGNSQRLGLHNTMESLKGRIEYWLKHQGLC